MAEIAFTIAVEKLSGQLERGLARSAGEEVMRIKDTIDDMKEFLNDADRKRNGNEEIEEWVTEARGLAYRVEDVVDESMIQRGLSHWHVTVLEICVVAPLGYFLVPPYTFVVVILPVIFSLFSSIDPLRKRFKMWKQLREIGKSVKKVREKMTQFELDSTVEERPINRPGATSSPSADFVGMEKHNKRMVEWLFEEETKELVAIFVEGVVGTGKTTLISRVYENAKMHFDCYAWAFVSQPYHKRDILRDLLKGFYESTSESAPSGVDEMEEESLKARIINYLQGKKYLLVLDNVLDEMVWEDIVVALPRGCDGAKVVLTTRTTGLSETLADEFTSHLLKIEGLSEEDARTLFRKRVLSHSHSDDGEEIPTELEEIEGKILAKCDGLPLAIVTIGALLSTKEKTVQEWQKVLDKLDSHLCGDSSNDNENNIFVSSGYANLSPDLKRCFLYCSVFPESYVIPRKRLIRLWVAEGFAQEFPGLTPEEVAGYQLEQLVARNMLQVARIGANGEIQSCRLLYLMRSFALSLSKRDEFCVVSSPNGEKIRGWKSLRRLSVHNDTTLIISKNDSLQSLRSLLFFGKNEPETFSISDWPSQLKLLLVLELQGIRLKILPPDLGDLILLRYLGLRGTGVKQLPKSLRKLNHLETLDVRQTDVRSLPDLYYLKQLRHLYLIDSFTGNVAIEPRGIMWLADIQTLSGIKVRGKMAQALRHLTQLRKLSVGKVRGEDSKELCHSINKMELLRSLAIKCDYGEHLNMEWLVRLPHLEKLKLGGQAGRLLDWVVRLDSLTYLYLWDNMLMEDPLSALQHLPNLVLLSLFNAYEGNKMHCDAGGFPKLKKLSILRLRELGEWERIESGAMPRLQKLFIGYCSKLKMFPQGLEGLPALQVLQVVEMPKEFEQAAQHNSNRNQAYKVQIIPQFTSASSAQGEVINSNQTVQN